VKLSKYIEKKKQESNECEELIVQARQTGDKLQEDIRLAQREKDLTLAKKQKEVDELRARVSHILQCSQATGWAKKLAQCFYTPITSPNINRFSKFFYCQNQKKICSKTGPRTLPHPVYVATLPCEISDIALKSATTLTNGLTWPPNSVDLNPVDYAVWVSFHGWSINDDNFTTINQLKKAIVTE